MRVNFDYAAFTISIGANTEKNKFTDLAIVVFGNKKKYKLLKALSEQLINKPLDKELVYDLARKEPIQFAANEKGSGEYLKELFVINLYRQLENLIETGNK